MTVQDPIERIELPMFYAHIADAMKHVEDESAERLLREACDCVLTLEEQQKQNRSKQCLHTVGGTTWTGR